MNRSLTPECDSLRSRVFRRVSRAAPGARMMAAALASAVLAASCSSGPSARVADRLDPNTGTTVIVLAQPVQLVTVENRGLSRDPFAFAAPFDVDRMGNRQLYLWVSVPNDNGMPASVRVLCGDRPLELARARLDLARLQLSRRPYAPVAPWSGDWYFELPQPALDCLAGAQSVTVESRIEDANGGHTERFAAQAADVRGFAAFAAHLRGP